MLMGHFWLSDLKRLNKIAMKAVKTGMVILGGGVVKHHICNANLMVSIFKVIVTKSALSTENTFMRLTCAH